MKRTLWLKSVKISIENKCINHVFKARWHRLSFTRSILHLFFLAMFIWRTSTSQEIERKKKTRHKIINNHFVITQTLFDFIQLILSPLSFSLVFHRLFHTRKNSIIFWSWSTRSFCRKINLRQTQPPADEVPNQSTERTVLVVDHVVTGSQQTTKS